MEATGRPLARLSFAATLVAALLLAACSSGTASNSGAQTAKPIKIGISLSRSGDFSDPATQVERGYQLWADHVNAKGGLLGRKVQLVVVDDASSPTQVVTNYQNLISRDKVDLVFGPFSSLLTIPSAQVAARYGYAFLEPEGGGPKVFAAKLRNLFFVQPAPAVSNGEVFAKWVLSLPAAERPKTAAYPSLDDPFASPVADKVREEFEAAGIRTVHKTIYPAETTDRTPIVQKVAAAHPDVVVAGTQSEDAYAQVKAMIQLGFSPKMLFLSNGANAPTEFPDKVGQLLEEVAAKTGSVDNSKIIQTLHSGTWSTIQGELRWDAYGAPQGSDVLLQWIGGTLDPVYPPAVASRQPVVAKAPWSR